MELKNSVFLLASYDFELIVSGGMCACVFETLALLYWTLMLSCVCVYLVKIIDCDEETENYIVIVLS